MEKLKKVIEWIVAVAAWRTKTKNRKSDEKDD